MRAVRGEATAISISPACKYVRTYVYIYSIYIYIYIYIYVYIRIIYVYIRTYIYIYIYVYIYTYTYVYIYTYVYTYVRPYGLLIYLSDVRYGFGQCMQSGYVRKAITYVTHIYMRNEANMHVPGSEANMHVKQTCTCLIERE